MAKPIKFEEVNVTYAENQEEYLPLPAFKDHNGTVLTCWSLSEEEIQMVKETGKIWLSQMTFNQPLQPVMITAIKSEVLITNTEEDGQG